MNRMIGFSLVALLAPVLAFGQGRRGDQPRGQQPQQDYHQQRQGGQSSPRGGERRRVQDPSNRAPAPRGHAENHAWGGRSSDRSAPSYGYGHSFGQGHFSGPLGRQHVWRLRGGRPDRFNVDGFFFQVAPYEAGYFNNWRWDDDAIVIYADPGYAGGYLAYNVRLGTYVHVIYLGS